MAQEESARDDETPALRAFYASKKWYNARGETGSFQSERASGELERSSPRRAFFGA